MRRRWSSDDSPAAIRSACSNNGYTCAGRTSLIRSSAGPAIGTLSSPPSAVGTASSCCGQSGLRPCSRNRIRVRHLSPPPISTTSACPRWMSRHAWLASDCGTFPPTPLYRVNELGGIDLRAEQQTGVAVPPGQDVDDADRVDGLQHPRLCRLPRGDSHQADRIRRLVLAVLVDLSGADEHRSSADRSASVRSSSTSAGRDDVKSTPSAISRSISAVSIPSIFWQTSRVCSPGIGAGRSSAGGILRYGAGPVSAGSGASNSGWAMWANNFRCLSCGSASTSSGRFIGPGRHTGLLQHVGRPLLVESVSKS